MVRSETFPFENFAAATGGQITWVILNQHCDYEERRERTHLGCLKKFDEELCEVCHKPLTGDANASDLPPELQDKVYRPGRDGVIDDVELEFDERQPSYSGGPWELVEREEEEIESDQ
jgi:hypothetical protein